MLRQTFGALLLTTYVAGTANATDWHFTYTGFLDEESGAFLPDSTLSGEFSGSDIDGNGIVSQEELTHFSYDGWWEYVGGNNCGDGSGYNHCSLTGFRYDLRGVLEFSTRHSYADYPTSNGFDVVAGAFIYSYYSSGTYDESSTLYWTPETEFAITPAPVPEPSIAAMLTAGLIAGLRGRHRRLRGAMAQPGSTDPMAAERLP